VDDRRRDPFGFGRLDRVALTVDPDSLRAAAAALDGCASRLDGDVDEFRRTANRAVPDLGREAVEAAGGSSVRAAAAVDAIATDLHELSRALRALADFYAAADATAVRR
jgi:uncharacterized protein YukE